MPTKDADEIIADLQREIDTSRAAYTELRERFADMVADHINPAPDLALDLVAYAEEFGREETIEQLRATPERFGFVPNHEPLSAEDMEQIAATMNRLIEASETFDSLVVEREHILCARDPSHERVYPSYGREFVMDWNAKKTRYVDRPDEILPLQVQVVEPKRAPEPRKPDNDLRPRVQAQPKGTKPRGPDRAQ